MNTHQIASQFNLIPEDNRRLANLCGQHNEHIHQLEEQLGVEIKQRGHIFFVSGQADIVKMTGKVLMNLYKATSNDFDLTPKEVHLVCREANVEKNQMTENQNTVAIHTKLKTIKSRGKNQGDLLQQIQHHSVNFAIGPAGTGKTYLAVAMAASALEKEEVQRVILTRPAVEAGERLGFLPGDLSQKVDPYLRPLYDALYEMLGFEYVAKLIEKNIIEVAPLAFMRGRNLNDAFIILDEGQNTSREQMKMFLTRIGFGSTAVITGDVTQVDLPRGAESGLVHAMKVLKGVEGVSFTMFDSKDVIRHSIVQKIVEAYGKHEEKK